MSKPKLVALAGSLREASLNKTLVKIAARGAEEAGADVTYVDLKQYPLSVYDQDLEDAEGLPENAKKLKEIFKTHDGFLISSPEYNSSISAALKNTIDWASRSEEGDKGMVAFHGKTAAIMSASPGALGGLRGLVHLRAILGNINVLVIPNQRAVNSAHQAFDESGNLKDEKLQENIMGIGSKLAETTSKLK